MGITKEEMRDTVFKSEIANAYYGEILGGDKRICPVNGDVFSICEIIGENENGYIEREIPEGAIEEGMNLKVYFSPDGVLDTESYLIAANVQEVLGDESNLAIVTDDKIFSTCDPTEEIKELADDPNFDYVYPNIVDHDPSALTADEYAIYFPEPVQEPII